MFEATFELLGPAEKLVAKQLHSAFSDLASGLEKVLDETRALADLDFEAVMLDKRKEAAIAMSDVMTGLPKRVSDLLLAVMVATAMFKERDGEEGRAA